MEGFYEFSCKFDALEIQEILYRNYADVGRILDFPIKEFIKFATLAYDKEEENKAHRQWCAMLPLMSMKLLKYMSFKEYYDQLTGKDIDTRPVDEIRADINKAHQRMKMKGE